MKIYFLIFFIFIQFMKGETTICYIGSSSPAHSKFAIWACNAYSPNVKQTAQQMGLNLNDECSDSDISGVNLPTQDSNGGGCIVNFSRYYSLFIYHLIDNNTLRLDVF
jgi:hypothetical protein